MPRDAERRVRRRIAGLLALAVLLFTGAQFSTAVFADAGRHGYRVDMTIAASDQRSDAPNVDHDHGLPCCIGGQCAPHAFWLSAHIASVPAVSQIVVEVLPSNELYLPGVLVEPSSPPPRAIV